MKPSKRKLDDEILAKYFLAYPYHRVKVVAKHIFSISKNGKAQRCGYTKSDSLRIKKDWGYTIEKNRNKVLERLQQASKVPLEHMLNNHDNFSTDWCFKKNELADGKEYKDKDDEFCCKENENRLYNLLKKTLFHFKQRKF